MSDSQSWAIATQQSYATGKSPRGFGTADGKKKAKAKFSQPKKSYVQTADPKIKKAEENSDMPISVEMVKLGGFSDELTKIAIQGRLGEAVRRGAQLLAGGKKTDVVRHVKNRPLNLLDKIKGVKNKGTDVVVGGAGPRAGTMANLKSSNPAHRREAQKVLGTRAVAGVAGVAGTGQAIKGHRKTERKQLGRAYVAGARDMYGLSRRR